MLLIPRKPPPGPREARPEDRLRGRLEGRTALVQPVQGSGFVLVGPYIGGLTPSFSAVTRGAVKVPSGFFSAIKKIAAPGFNRLWSPGT
jgi:hypothetical protein